MSTKIPYKYCIVPNCVNTTINAREKLFFHVPKDPVKRLLWTKAMKRDEKLNPKLSSISTLYCCEDHFSLPHDMENYCRWKIMKDVKRIQLKPGIIPHIFHCQKEKPLPEERSAVKKRKTMHLVAEAMSAQCPPVQSQVPSSSSMMDAPSTSSGGTSDCTPLDNTIQDSLLEIGIQVDIKKPYKSRGTSTSVKMVSVCSMTSNVGVNVSTATSPEKLQQTTDHSDDNIDDDSECDSTSDFELSEEVESTDNFSSNEDIENEKFKEHMVKGTIMSIEKEPKLYLGIPKESFFLIKLLSDRTKLPVNHIYLVLKKIRLNSQFKVLAIDFGMAESTVCRIFSKSLLQIASLMQELIVWKNREAVQAHLPIPFRARYGHVISIIDCLEIEIEKPSDPLSQALTWSSYYNCNTLKYLVSCTPDGLVSFISDGFGGRASDVIIVENCGYLDKLLAGDCVMADRGFKNISCFLQKRNCTLIRPPSVSSETKSTKEEVKESKRIAALRIHVERVIRRLREFKMLSPHACVDTKHTSILDFVVVVACGIINMQDHLIKC